MNLSALITAYQSDPDSTYTKLRYRTRLNNGYLCARIDREYGATELTAINARLLKRFHEGWAVDGKIAMAHSLIAMLRTICSFGATLLEDDQCNRLCSVLHKMRFETTKPRVERLTADQATAIIAKAHELGLHALALAQGFQFPCTLRQKDILGEWVPIAEPGLSDVTHDGWKWLRGIRWEEIDANMILRHVTSKRQKEIEVDLTLDPMVMNEIRRMGVVGRSGPIVVHELTGLPYEAHRFRRDWRKVARLVGVPDAVFNMDSRSGAITEASDAGADMEHIRHAAAHSNIAMTQKYSRNAAGKVAGVMTKRVAHRMGEAVGGAQ